MTNPAPRSLVFWTLGLLLLGLLWRAVRYLLAFPIWGDEALLGMSIAQLDHAQLTHRLDNCQIAPLLFLWGQRSLYLWLGPGELAMRLLPFLAGTVALVLFWRWAGLVLDVRARLCAVGYLAVAIWPVSMSTFLKPYSCDLLMALLLLVPATGWLCDPGRVGWLLVLAVCAPVALLGSYPAAFVGGSVALALLVPAWRAGWPARAGYVLFAVGLLTGFALALAVGNSQLASATNGVDTRAGMLWYWGDSFPPASLWQFPGWLFLQTCGQMSAYPVGGSDGLSIVTVVCCGFGVATLVRRQRWPLLVLCLGPVLLNLLAACLHRYPYGASGRLTQHLAPGLCLLAGVGLADLVVRLEWRWQRPGRALAVVVAFFVFVGVVGLARDLVHPYRDPGCAWMRDTLVALDGRIPPGAPVVVCAPPQRTECVCAWYWLTHRPGAGWDGVPPAEAATAGDLWAFHQGDDPDASCQRVAQRLHDLDPDWRLVERLPCSYRPGASDAQFFELFHFTRMSSERHGLPVVARAGGPSRQEAASSRR